MRFSHCTQLEIGANNTIMHPPNTHIMMVVGLQNAQYMLQIPHKPHAIRDYAVLWLYCFFLLSIPHTATYIYCLRIPWSAIHTWAIHKVRFVHCNCKQYTSKPCFSTALNRTLWALGSTKHFVNFAVIDTHFSIHTSYTDGSCVCVRKCPRIQVVFGWDSHHTSIE